MHQYRRFTAQVPDFQRVGKVSFTVNADAVPCSDCPINFVDGLGSPPVNNRYSNAGDSIVPSLVKKVPGAVALHRPLGELAGVLRASTAYVGNDSGVSHLAAAVGAATVAVFVATDPAQWAPRGPAWLAMVGAPTRDGPGHRWLRRGAADARAATRPGQGPRAAGSHSRTRT